MLEVDAVEVEEVVSPGESLVSVSLEALLGPSWLGMAVVVGTGEVVGGGVLRLPPPICKASSGRCLSITQVML